MDLNAVNPDHDRSKLGKILDPSVKIKVGKKLTEYLESRRNDVEFKEYRLGLQENECSKDSLVFKVPDVLTVPQVKLLLTAVKAEKKSGTKPGNFSLCDLLSDSQILLPTLEIPERNPELEKRVNRLRHQLAEQEYQKMTKNVNLGSRYNPEDSIGTELKKMNTGLIAVFQFIITVGAAFLFGFMGLEVFIGISFELAVKLLLGIVFALVVGAAELYFLVINMDFEDKESSGYQKMPHHRPQLVTEVSKSEKKNN